MRSIPDPGFPGDDGSADPALAESLAAYDRAAGAEEVGHRHFALSALQDARVLVPVVAMLGEVEYDVPPGGRAGSRLPREKTSDMASVLMTGRDGRTALLAFTGNASLTAWDPDARPVPVTAQQAARAAIQDQASALLLDVAGPVLFVVEGDELDALARGHRLVHLDGGRWGWAATGA
jgi:hypothetical protein